MSKVGTACMCYPVPGVGARSALAANHGGAGGCEGEEQPSAQLQVPRRAADGLSAGTSQQGAAGQHPRRAGFVQYPGLCTTVTAAARPRQQEKGHL